MKAKRWSLVIILLLVGLALAPYHQVVAEASWSTVVPGAPCIGAAEITDINNNRQILGKCLTDAGIQIYVWTIGGDVRILGPGTPAALNDRGQVVGYQNGAALWNPDGSVIHLGTLGGSWSYTHDINNDGWVVGESRIKNEEIHAMLWTPRKGMIDLGTLGGNESQAVAANDRGQIVGWSRIASGATRGFIWTPERGMQEIGTFGGNYSRAYDINNHGQVVGASWTADDTIRAFVWTEAGGLVDLGGEGVRGSYGYSINEHGAVAGSGGFGREETALLWSPTQGMVILNVYADWGSRAIALNDAGDVLMHTWRGIFEGQDLLWQGQD